MTSEEEKALRAEYERIGNILSEIDFGRTRQKTRELLGTCWKRSFPTGNIYSAVTGFEEWGGPAAFEFEDGGEVRFEVNFHTTGPGDLLSENGYVRISREEYDRAWEVFLEKVSRLDPHKLYPLPPALEP